MKLSELLLNRWLYKDNTQSLETKDSTAVSLDSNTPDPAAIPSGGAAQDINTGNVTINGEQITPGTIPQSVLDIANWGWGQTSAFSSASATQVNWGTGTFKSASGDTYSISSGNTGTMAAKTYIYFDVVASETTYQVTTTPGDAVGIGKVLVAVAQNGATSATFNLNEATQIVGDNILANTINATKMNVGQLSAISADLGSITAGTITGATIRTSASGLRVEITGDDLWSYDSGGVLRMQLSGDSLAFSNASGVLVGTLISTTNSLGISAGTDKSIYSIGNGTGNAGLAIGASNYFYASGSLGYNVSAKHIIPTSTAVDLGSSGSHFGTIYVDNIVGASSGATTSLDNLASVAINTSLKSDTDATDDLGSSSIAWRHLYLGGTGNIYFNNEIVFDFSTASNTAFFGSAGITTFEPYSDLGADLGSSSGRWSTTYTDSIETNSIDLNGGDMIGTDQVSGTSGNIDFSITGRIQVSTYFDPADAGTYNLGGSSRYWNDVSYKTLTDRGCLGWYDDGVEMRDGRVLTDLEALKSLKKHPTLKTPAGAPRIDYTSMPKHVYVPPMNHKKELLPMDENGEYYEMVEQRVKNKTTGKMEKKMVKMKAEEGAETTALIAMMLGAIKELGGKVEVLEAALKKK